MIFKHLDYRDFIKTLVEKKPSPHSYQSLAQAMQMQKSYLSRILKGSGQLNQDQGYHLAGHLGLSDSEQDYLEMIIEYDRTALQKRKKNLKAKIQQIQKSKIQSKEFLSKSVHEQTLSDYYLNPWLQIVHLALLVEGVSKDNHLKIAGKLGLTEKRLSETVQKLLDLNLIEVKAGRFFNKSKGMHLSAQHPLTAVNHSLFRTATAAKVQQLDPEELYSFTASITADSDTFLEIKAEFLSFLKKIEPYIDKAPSKDVYQIHFDLFPWMRG